MLVTGAAGFIGFHTVRRLLADGRRVVGLDSINDYYEVELKHARLAQCGIDAADLQWNTPQSASAAPSAPGAYTFVRARLEDADYLQRLFAEYRFSHVCHLAAQAGVRYSLTNPRAYVDSNLTGFLNLLEACRANPPRHLVYASTSSVYGLNRRMPFSPQRPADHPVSLYAASKKANEAMAHSYSHLFGLPATGLRFFTVYGPWGRPDMALFLFTRAMLAGKPITLFNNGNMQRDFTFVDDIVEGVVRVLFRPAAPVTSTVADAASNPASRAAAGGRAAGAAPVPATEPESDPSCSEAPWRIYNIGNGSPVALMDFVRAIEDALGRTARIEYAPMQPGDVAATWADCGPLEHEFGFRPRTAVADGVRRFVDWYLMYYHGAPERSVSAADVTDAAQDSAEGQ
ncbi:MAG: NAD-dependent epimerase [Spirochaetaceae bacterium]|nr:MAG: NAD-dependent epimerase [Spirochaetaceae bacterium]